jgi:protein gp37
MTIKTSIPWTDETWNPITGCSPISEGCLNCYARRMAQRLKGRYGYPKDEPFKPGNWRGDWYIPSKKRRVFEEPLGWKTPRMIFVCSMGDIFHESVPEPKRKDVFRMIMFPKNKKHIFLILTKRPQKMAEFINIKIPNLWLGVTAENQKRADERIPLLLQTLARVRFVSIEPMLGPVESDYNAIPFFPFENEQGTITPGIDWVIAGPETGPGKRECKPEWIRDLYEQCQTAGVPFFDKTKKNWIAREFPK